MITHMTYIMFNMTNTLESYPKQLDNMTSDLPLHTEHLDPNSLDRTDLWQHQT
jgi:hypothetical protein